MKRRSFKFSGQKRARLREELAKQGRDVGFEVIERRKNLSVAPMSFGQKRLWFLEQLEPGATYLMPASIRLRGPLELAALASSLSEITRRHEVLRARFPEVDGEPTQEITAPERSAIPMLDLEFLNPEQRGREAWRWIRSEATRPFDLTADALVRWMLVRFNVQEHLLFINLHHIITDGVSVKRFVGELCALYGTCEGQSSVTSPLPQLPIQYADFAAWQQQRLSGDYLESQLAWWREALTGVPEVLELPVDRPRRPVRRALGARLGRSLPLAQCVQLEQLARQQNCTLFLALLAVFELLLHRLTGQTDLVLGTPFAGRDRRETSDLIGFFVNTLILRAHLGAEPSFVELMNRLSKVASGAFSHQDLPFERLVEELQPRRNLSQTPLVQVLFALEGGIGIDPRSFRLGSVEAELVELERGAATFDFALLIKSTSDGLAAEVEYSTDLFDPTTVERWLMHFERLLEHAVADPGLPVASFELLSPAERQQQLLEWNDTAVSADRDTDTEAPRLLHELFQLRALEQPDAVALVSGEVHTSYRELAERAARLARYLCVQGVKPEMRVAVLAQRGPDLVIALLGILEAGAAYVGLDPDYPAERLEFLLRDSKAALLLTTEAIDLLPPTEALVVRLPLRASADGDLGYQPERDRTRSGSPGHLAYLIYTSGSTGRPKGVAIAHRNAVELMQWARRHFDNEQLSGVLAATSVCFDLSVFEIFVPLSWGGTIVLARNALALQNLPAAWQVTLINTVPSAISALVSQQAIPASARTINLAGEALSGDLVARIYRCAPWVERVLNLYGPSEDTTYSTFTTIPSGAQGEPSIGCPVDATQAFVVDSRFTSLPFGAIGELVLGGACLARCYLDRPRQTAAAFVPSPWSTASGERSYHTGDRVRWRATGELQFFGRLDHQVKLRGFRIELGEIEASLVNHPAVCEATLTVRDQVLVAFVVANGVSPTELGEFLRGRLPGHMVPTSIVQLDALPLLPNKKVDRKALERVALPDPSGSLSDVTAGTPNEEIVAGIFAVLLGREQVGIHDSFFELGGHSLLAVRVVARIRDMLGVELPIQTLFEAPRVTDLSQRIEQARRAGDRHPAPPLVAQSRGDSLELSFSQQRLWFLDRLEPASALYNLPIAVRLKGVLDIARLEQAFDELIRRHEVLRTTFSTERGVARQVIHPWAPRRLPVIDSSGDAFDLRRLVDAEAKLAFDLERGPLLRVQVSRLAADDHLLLLTLHHIVSDGWSIGVMLREIAALYRGIQLEEISFQYGDFALWQRRWLEGEVLKGQLAYWRQVLADIAPLELPTDRPYPPVPNHRGAVVEAHFPAPLVQELTSLGRVHGATLFMTLLAVFSLLMARLTRQREFAVGTPTAGRTHSEIEELIGFFVNTLVLPVAISGPMNFVELLSRTRRTVLSAHDHSDVPFEQLVSALVQHQDPSRSPLFQTMFSLDEEVPPLDLPGIEATLWPQQQDGVKFDLDVAAARDGEGVSLTLGYRTDLFDATTIIRLKRSFQLLAQAVSSNPDQQFETFDVLARAERHQLVMEWPGSLPVAPGVAANQRTLVELFEAQVERSPDSLAVSFREQNLSFGALDERSEELARYLGRHGVGPETSVALLMERSPETMVAILGILRQGGAYVPLDPSFPAERLCFVLDETATSVILTQSWLADLLPGDGAPVVCLDREWPEVAEEHGGRVGRSPGPENLAYILYTSGSTGVPKGVQIEHRAVADLGAVAAVHGPHRIAFTAPLIFDASVEQWVHLLFGCCLCLPDESVGRGVGLLVDWLIERRVEILDMTPTHLRYLIDEGLFRSSSLQRLVIGGEALPESLWATLAANEAIVSRNAYGLTECTVDSASAWVEPGTAPNIGRPLAHVRLFVVDRELRPQPVGVAGELLIGGSGLARGYWGQPGLTAERFLPDPWDCDGARLYRTGDLCRWVGGGVVEYLGRVDHQVKIRGFRIELGDIETNLKRHPGLRDAVVVARGENSDRQQLVAFVEVEEGQDTEELVGVELRQDLQQRLPSYMVPSVFVAVPTLPLTVSGKVDRHRLPEVEENRQETTFVAPRTATESVLAGIFSEVLEIEDVGVNDSFFELGGHSLLATRVQFRVQEELSRDVPLAELFRNDTVATLAGFVEGSAGTVEEDPGKDLTATRRSEQTLDELLASIDDLSEEEMLALLEDTAREPASVAFGSPESLEGDDP